MKHESKFFNMPDLSFLQSRGAQQNFPALFNGQTREVKSLEAVNVPETAAFLVERSGLIQAGNENPSAAINRLSTFLSGAENLEDLVARVRTYQEKSSEVLTVYALEEKITEIAQTYSAKENVIAEEPATPSA